jgi:hypothetical protein
MIRRFIFTALSLLLLSVTASLAQYTSPRLVFGFSSYNTNASQPNFALALGDLTHSGDYFYSSNTLSLGYQWTRRFSTISSYTFNALYYDDTAVGTTLNRFEHIFGQQFRFQVVPTATAVLEYRFGYVQYLSASGDSYSHYLLAGADITLSPRLTFHFPYRSRISSSALSGRQRYDLPLL